MMIVLVVCFGHAGNGLNFSFGLQMSIWCFEQAANFVFFFFFFFPPVATPCDLLSLKTRSVVELGLINLSGGLFAVL